MKRAILIGLAVFFMGIPSRSALWFDGNDDYVEFSNITLAGTFSITFWWYNDNAANDQCTPFSDDGGGLGSKFQDGGGGKITYRVISGGSADTSVNRPTINKWQHVAVTRNSSDKVDLYINGGTASRLFSDAAQSGNHVVAIIGKHGGTQFVQGFLDDFRVYNRVLSASEIESLAKSRSRLTITDGLLAWWTFDQGVSSATASGATALDKSGNGRTGTPTSGPLWSASNYLNYP